jgi:hypothetical protein
MMNRWIKSVRRRVRGKSVPEVAALLLRKVGNLAEARMQRQAAFRRDIRGKQFPDASLQSRINVSLLDASAMDVDILKYLGNMYVSHRFDILGSGWTPCGYSDEGNGFEGYQYRMNLPVGKIDQDGAWMKGVVAPNHLEISRRVWRMVEPGYLPIDWQKDHKSGFRFGAVRWHRDIRFGTHPGVDIKVPWELGRLQHLPQLAVIAIALPTKRREAIREFRNQVLDFIATNPPCMGVNWACTMDVAIRIVNVLLAFDILRQIDTEGLLDPEFCCVIGQSAAAHGEFIREHLERSGAVTSNHYLADLAGLIFVAAYLPGLEDASSWMRYAIAEFVEEFGKQFYADGGNFESSTSYHRLSVELVTYSVAVYLGLEGIWATDVGVLPDWLPDRLLRAGNFTQRLTKPTGDICQFGDNDSGRFLRFSPCGRFLTGADAVEFYENLRGVAVPDVWWDENHLDHRTLLSALSGLFSPSPWPAASGDFPFESSIIRALARGATLPSGGSREESLKHGSRLNESTIGPYVSRVTIVPRVERTMSLRQNLRTWWFPDSGYYIFSSNRLFLAVNGSPVGQMGNGGHSHNDKLSIELVLDGEDVLIDPGTYVYTPLLAWRDRFRSVRYHNAAVIHGEEQNPWESGMNGVFKTEDQTRCEVEWADEGCISLLVYFRGWVHRRRVDILDQEVTVSDFCNEPFSLSFQPAEWFSNGYGKRHRFPSPRWRAYAFLRKADASAGVQVR